MEGAGGGSDLRLWLDPSAPSTGHFPLQRGGGKGKIFNVHIIFMKHTMRNTKAFTLIEILLVVVAIAILAGIVILAINPTKQLGDTRNAARHADVTTILNAVYQYSLDNNGMLPTIPSNSTCDDTAAYQICKSGATGTCSAGVDLSVIKNNQKYVTSIPIDPSVSSTDGTGYYIVRSGNNRVTVCAPSAEQGATISVTR